MNPIDKAAYVASLVKAGMSPSLALGAYEYHIGNHHDDFVISGSSTEKGYNPGQPRDPKGSPTGGRWASVHAGIRGALAKAGGKLQGIAKNPKVLPQGPALLPNGESRKLGKLERVAISQGVKQLMAKVPITNMPVRTALSFAANFMIPRLIARLSPTYSKMVMSFMYGALVKSGIDALASVITLVSAARAGTLEEDMQRAMEQMQPSNMSKADLDALVANYGSGSTKETKDGGLEETAAKIAELCTRWMNEEKTGGTKKEASIFTTKESDGRWRWTVIGSGAYGPDRDGEWMTEKALRGWADGFNSDKGTVPVRSNGETVSLRWWHVGKPDAETLTKGPGIDLGVCDFAAVHSKSMVMSGLFDDPEVGEVISKNLDKLGASIGFFHPESQPGTSKEFHTIEVYEVSLLPVERASYPFTGLTVAKGN